MSGQDIKIKLPDEKNPVLPSIDVDVNDVSNFIIFFEEKKKFTLIGFRSMWRTEVI